jgi:hypothetical protein
MKELVHEQKMRERNLRGDERDEILTASHEHDHAGCI